ncbi:MAG: carboxypeptidase-like regulatory domain-containing protein [Deltaproteobacteria bacterium]|jgi:hypothetical protein|nr:carboxypeptidase-like regulatory domain-containing protein [Deltaproteobacteria bacterium]
MKYRALAKLMAFAIPAFFIIAGCGSAGAVSPMIIRITVWGYVTDVATSVPLVGANVQITGVGSMTTGTDGYYSFVVSQYGTWTVTASKPPGFKQTSASGTINEGTRLRIDILAQHSNGAYAYVRNDTTNALIGGAAMWHHIITDFDDYWGIETYTDANGYAFLGNYPGTYGDDFIADKNDYWGNYQHNINLNHNNPVQYTFYLKASEKKEIIVCGVYLTGVSSLPGASSDLMSFYYQSGSTITYSVVGDFLCWGWVHDTTTTVQGGSIQPHIPVSGDTGWLYKARVEVSGVMNGVKPSWTEACRYVRETEAMWPTSINTPDPVGRTDPGVNTGPIQGIAPNGHEAIIVASMQGADLWTDKFNIPVTYHGLSASMGVNRVTASTYSANLECHVTNSNGGQNYLWYYSWIQETNDSPTKGIIMHIWLDHVAPP